MEEREHTLTEQEEKELEKHLRSLTEDTPIPETLQPKSVERLLEKRKKERKGKLRRYLAGAAAACLCLAVGIPAGYVLMRESGAMPGTGPGSDMQSTASDAATPESSETSPRIASARDYDEIYDYIEAGENYRNGILNGGNSADGEIAESAADEASGSSASSGARSDTGASASYSDTNVRADGVTEADIIKTDGKNLYLVREQTVEIVSLDDGEMEKMSEIGMQADCWPTELYVENGKLIVIYLKAGYGDGTPGYGDAYREYTCADVYDVSSAGEPKLLGSISQSGYYDTMRVREGHVYLFSTFYTVSGAARGDTALYVPEVRGEVMAAEDIYMPQMKMGSQYTVITAFEMNSPGEETDSKAVFGSSEMCYVSAENIYITESLYGENGSDVTQTSIRKIAYKDGRLEGISQTKVDGTLNDSFSIDEYGGNLRLVTTVSGTANGGIGFVPLFEDDRKDTNSLYVLDGDLEVVGEIHDLAEDESVYSARFMGNTGYFVTYRQVDPLFSVDLSDPGNPQILGELKIPGFSEYLHPYGEGLLLGIGMDVDKTGTVTDGVKLSMFDISEPGEVQEAQKYVIENMYGTDVYNYKSVFVDTEKNLFGFTAYGDGQKYYIFSYDAEEGFREEFVKEIPYGNARGLYVGDCFYLATQNTIESYTLDGFEKVEDIVL